MSTHTQSFRQNRTTNYRIQQKHQRSLRTYNAGPEVIKALWSLDQGDPNAQQPYQPVLVRGRLVK